MKLLNPDAGEWLKYARQRLKHIEDGGLAAQVLLAHVVGKTREFVLAHSEFRLDSDQLDRLERLLSRFEQGEPLAYLTGQREFFGLTFGVSPAVLIPRPETEILVEKALDWLKRHPQRRLAADVGTGSGCIAASLAYYLPDLKCVAVDRSWQALQIARWNFERLGVLRRVFPVMGNLLDACGGLYDLVCANLPYIPADELSRLPVSRFEPQLALNGGMDGLDWIAALLEDSSRWLTKGGLLLLEIGAAQAESVTRLAANCLPAAQIEVIHDLQGLPRVVLVEQIL
ncbi:MAG: peptide chain release factor N(5)-glutamine methyltransferase [Chloroflexota bacterium]